jgi:Mn-dependent DtxR family transcriptional regulator
VTGHEKKEAIIRYLAHVGRANRHQIAKTIKASPEIVSNGLKELKYSGIVKNVEWPDGSKVWLLTKEGEERFDYYVKRDRQRAN